MGCRLSLVRLCDSDFGITTVDDITVGIICAVFCFHMAHISFFSSWYLFCLSVIYYYYYYYYYKLQLSCHSVAVVLTLVQTKQIRINIHKKQYKKRSTNNTKDFHFFVLFFIRAIFKLYICIPTNCTQLIYFINNTLKHMYCLKLQRFLLHVSVT